MTSIRKPSREATRRKFVTFLSRGELEDVCGLADPTRSDVATLRDAVCARWDDDVIAEIKSAIAGAWRIAE